MAVSPSVNSLGREAGVGEGEGGDGVVGEHPLADIAVAAGLVAHKLLKVDGDDGRAAVEMHLAGEGRGAHHGVVGQWQICQFLPYGEGGFGAHSDQEGDAFDLAYGPFGGGFGWR